MKLDDIPELLVVMGVLIACTATGLDFVYSNRPFACIIWAGVVLVWAGALLRMYSVLTEVEE